MSVWPWWEDSNFYSSFCTLYTMPFGDVSLYYLVEGETDAEMG